MKVNNSKQKFQWTGLGLIFGAAIGFLVGIIIIPAYFIWFGLGGAGGGLILGSIIDAQTRDGGNEGD